MRGVIFDFNGVLVFDSPLHHLAWREFALKIRGQTLSDLEMRESVMGRTNFEILRFLLQRSPTPQEVAQLGGEKERYYRAMCGPGSDFALSPGAVALLDELVRRGVPRTIATSSERENLDFFITRLELGRWFALDDIVYDDGTRPGKPAPDVYIEAARRIGTAPEHCAVIEDAVSGVHAAAAAGIGRIFALAPHSEQERFRAIAAVTDTIETLGGFPLDQVRVLG